MAAPHQLVGLTLGHFHILGKIGIGGMGVVYRAHDERLDRDVALKVLPPGALSDENARKRFRKEALALAKLNHPNIATIHDFDTQGGIDFLVMEYVEGVTLTDKLSKGALVENQVLGLGTQIATTLEDAHEHGIVHCDLKPSNIMITPKGLVKVLDFGLAKLMWTSETTATASLSEVHQAAGTLPYMAPEQLRGDPTDARTDIYAVGALLYEMATGRRPFPQHQTPQLIEAILHEDPLPPNKLSLQTSPMFENVVLKALDKDPDHRYQSAKELCVDLERLELRHTVQRTGSPSRLSRSLLGLVGAFLVLVVVLTFLLRHTNKPIRGGEPKQVLIADLDNRTGDPDFDDSLTTALSTYLEQSRLVTVFPVARVHAAVQALGRAADARIDANLGSQVCIREGIPLLITVEISHLHDQYLLAVRILNPADQRILSAHSAEAPEKSAVLAALGRTARELRLEIGEQRSLVEQNDKLLEQVTTTSLPALQLYTLARKEHLRGNYEAAVALYKNAIRLDPQFALAYARLSNVYRNLGDSASSRLYMNKAITLLDHVTERERYTLLGLSAAYDEDFEQGIDNFLVLTRLYPDDFNGHFYLALCYLLTSNLDGAVTEAKIATTVDPSASAYNNLAEVLLAQNRFEEVVELLRANPALNEGGLVRAYLGLGQIENSQKEVDRLLGEHDEQTRALAAQMQLQVWLFGGRWGQAETSLREALSVGKDRNFGRNLTLVALVLQRGDYSQADQLLRKFKQVPSFDSQNVIVGVLSSQAHERSIARRVLREIESRLAVRKARRLEAYSNLLRGTLALDGGGPTEALVFLESARAGWDNIVVRSAYAQALFSCGRWSEARKEFEGIYELKGQALDDPVTLILWKQSPYWVGRSLQAQGDATGSRLKYQEFLRGWPDGELGWLATQDAARRLRPSQ